MVGSITHGTGIPFHANDMESHAPRFVEYNFLKGNGLIKFPIRDFRSRILGRVKNRWSLRILRNSALFLRFKVLETEATLFLVTFTIKLLEVYSTGVKAIGRITVPRKTVSPPPPVHEEERTDPAPFPLVSHSRYHHVARPSLRTMARNKERGNKGILACPRKWDLRNS